MVEFITLIGEPREWPTWLRRLFLLTLPVSLPLWLAACVIVFFACTVALLVALGARQAADLWRGSL